MIVVSPYREGPPVTPDCLVCALARSAVGPTELAGLAVLAPPAPGAPGATLPVEALVLRPHGIVLVCCAPSGTPEVLSAALRAGEVTTRALPPVAAPVQVLVAVAGDPPPPPTAGRLPGLTVCRAVPASLLAALRALPAGRVREPVLSVVEVTELLSALGLRSRIPAAERLRGEGFSVASVAGPAETTCPIAVPLVPPAVSAPTALVPTALVPTALVRRGRVLAGFAAAAAVLVAFVAVLLILDHRHRPRAPVAVGAAPLPAVAQSAAAPPSPPPPSASPVTVTRQFDGLTFTRQLVVTEADCAAHAYGQVAGYLQEHPCVGLERALWSATVDGADLGVSVSVVRMADAGTAAALRALTDAPGTGNVSDLLREGRRYPGAPAGLTHPGYASALEGATVVVVEAGFADRGQQGADTLDRVSRAARALAS